MHRYKLLSFYLESRFFLEAHIIYKNEQDRKHFLIKYMSFDLNEIKLAGNYTLKQSESSWKVSGAWSNWIY